MLVVLALLAALAIPTFARVIERSRDAKTLTALRAVARNSQALAAFDERAVTPKDVETAGQETSATAAGVSAAGTLLAAPGLLAAPTSQLGYSLVTSGGTVTLRPADGRLCAVGFTRTAMGVGTCVPDALAGSDGGTLANDALVLPGGSSAGSTSATTSAPGSPGGLATSNASASSLNLSWTPVAANGSSVSRYDVYLSGSSASYANAPGTATSVVLTGLSASATNPVVLRATNSVGQGPAATTSSATSSASAAAYAAATGDGPLAFYPLGDPASSTTAADSSGNNRPATCSTSWPGVTFGSAGPTPPSRRPPSPTLPPPSSPCPPPPPRPRARSASRAGSRRARASSCSTAPATRSTSPRRASCTSRPMTAPPTTATRLRAWRSTVLGTTSPSPSTAPVPSRTTSTASASAPRSARRHQGRGLRRLQRRRRARPTVGFDGSDATTGSIAGLGIYAKVLTPTQVASHYEGVMAPSVLDTFNRTDASTLGTATSGAVWHTYSGSYSITSGQPVAGAGGGRASLAVPSGDFDARLSYSGMYGYPALNFRVVDSANYCTLQINDGGGFNYGCLVNGAWQTLRQSGYTPQPTGVLRVVGKGNTFQFYNNTLLLDTVTLTANSGASRIGIQQSDAARAFTRLSVFLAS